MKNIFIDFECWYSKDYTLRKLSTLQYLRDSRYNLFGMGYAIDNGPPFWVDAEHVNNDIHELDLPNNRVICHNINFDGALIVEKYGIHAKQWACTLGLARAFLPFERNDVDSIGKALGRGGKKPGGKLLQTENPTQQQLNEIGEYCLEDVEICRLVWNICSPHQPEAQLKLQHIIAQWAIDPILRINLPKMLQGVQNATTKRNSIILASGLPEKLLSSNKQFEQWLLGQGITPPTKISRTTEEETLAFSKSDPEFIELQTNHPELNHVWLGRLAAKSNIDITRPQRMYDLGSTGAFPMPLNYWGAHTGRKSGADKLNVQNFPNA